MQITGPPERAFFNKLNRKLKMKRFRVLLCTLLSVLFLCPFALADTYQGVDIAHYAYSVDFNQLKMSGHGDFVYIKTSIRRESSRYPLRILSLLPFRRQRRHTGGRILEPDKRCRIQHYPRCGRGGNRRE